MCVVNTAPISVRFLQRTLCSWQSITTRQNQTEFGDSMTFVTFCLWGKMSPWTWIPVKRKASSTCPRRSCGSSWRGGQGQSQSHPLAKNHCREVSVPVVASPGWCDLVCGASHRVWEAGRSSQLCGMLSVQADTPSRQQHTQHRAKGACDCPSAINHSFPFHQLCHVFIFPFLYFCISHLPGGREEI